MEENYKGSIMSDSKKKSHIKFKYVFDKKYNPKYISGAQGGLTPRNEIVLNFFFERQPIPFSETHNLNENGTIGDITAAKPKLDKNLIRFVRVVENGIVMNLETAKEIHKFLEDQIDLLENKQNGKK